MFLSLEFREKCQIWPDLFEKFLKHIPEFFDFRMTTTPIESETELQNLSESSNTNDRPVTPITPILHSPNLKDSNSSINNNNNNNINHNQNTINGFPRRFHSRHSSYASSTDEEIYHAREEEGHNDKFVIKIVDDNSDAEEEETIKT